MKEKKGKRQEEENKSNRKKKQNKIKHGKCGICSDREYSFFILSTPTPYSQPPPL